jgi:hypothetical protein
VNESLVGAVRVGAVLSRRRRREQPLRDRRVTVRFSEEEYARVAANAAGARLALAAYLAQVGTAPRIAACRSGAEERADLLVELMGTHRQLRGACTNLNQAVARWHTTGQQSGELPAIAEHVRRVTGRVDAAVAAVVASR